MAGKTKKRRFGKRLTLFREAVKKLEPAHRTPHVVTVLGVAMGLTEEKIGEEIGLAAAMFGHLASKGPMLNTWYPCRDAACPFGTHKHEHMETAHGLATRNGVA